jgi:hypothetical protein
MSIQFWPSNPRKVKRSTRNCTAPNPLSMQDRLSAKNILSLYFQWSDLRRVAISFSGSISSGETDDKCPDMPPCDHPWQRLSRQECFNSLVARVKRGAKR